MKLKSKLSSDNQSDIYKDAIESTGLLDKLSNDISFLDSDYIKLITMESQLINMTESLSSHVCLFQHIIKYSEDIINIMPQLDGFGVLNEIKSKDIKMPIIVVSNLSQDEDISKAKEMGATDFFVKSDTPVAEIVEKIKKYL